MTPRARSNRSSAPLSCLELYRESRAIIRGTDLGRSALADHPTCQAGYLVNRVPFTNIVPIGELGHVAAQTARASPGPVRRGQCNPTASPTPTRASPRRLAVDRAPENWCGRRIRTPDGIRSAPRAAPRRSRIRRSQCWPDNLQLRTKVRDICNISFVLGHFTIRNAYRCARFRKHYLVLSHKFTLAVNQGVEPCSNETG